MTRRRALREWLADRLTNLAADRLRRRYPEWADAIVSEHTSLQGDENQLGWAIGSLRASLHLQDLDDGLYPALLLASVAAMALYQWSADESLITVLVISLLSLCLGLHSPRHFVASGLAIGVMVTGVNSFETLSGIRPAYEISAHSLIHNLRWLVFIPPALASSALGRQLNLKLRA